MWRRAGKSVAGGSGGSCWVRFHMPGCPVLVHKTRASRTSCPQPGPTLDAEMTAVLVKVERERSLHSRGRNGRDRREIRGINVACQVTSATG